MNLQKTMLILLVIVSGAVHTVAAPMPAAKKALVVGTPHSCDMYAEHLKTEYVSTKINKNNGADTWAAQGYVLPKFEELKQYDLIVITPLINTVADNQEDIAQFITHGGNFIILYNSLEITLMKTKELGYGICGFDNLVPVILRPYPKSGKMLHKLSYTGKMGKKDFEKEYLYTVYAGDLVEAEPLIVNPDQKGLALATVTKVGKGQFIFYGGEDKLIFFDILKACGLMQ